MLAAARPDEGSAGRVQTTDGLLGDPARAELTPTHLVLRWGREYELWVYEVGLACCAVEFVAATMTNPTLLTAGLDPFPAPVGRAHVLVVSGTVTHKQAASVRALYDGLPEPRYVLSFGACANTGGPYWDSYCVTKGVSEIVPVDVFVPGCPPRPESLLGGLAALERVIAVTPGTATTTTSAP